MFTVVITNTIPGSVPSVFANLHSLEVARRIATPSGSGETCYIYRHDYAGNDTGPLETYKGA